MVLDHIKYIIRNKYKKIKNIPVIFIHQSYQPYLNFTVQQVSKKNKQIVYNDLTWENTYTVLK
jgi:hypothetical protein